MKKKAKDLKPGDKIFVGGEEILIKEIELSEIGKHGTQKCRIVGEKQDKEEIILIRPAEYPFNSN